MKLRFTNTMDDLLALSEYNAHSRTLRRNLRRYQWGGATAIFGLTFLLLTMLQTTGADLPVWLTLLLPLIYAGLFAWSAPRRYRRSIRHNVRKVYEEGINRRFFCEHELEVVPDGLIERTPYSETKMAWGAIEKFEATADHTLIFVGSAAAFVIPNQRIDSGDLRTFMDTLRIYYVPDQPLQKPLIAAPTPPPVAVPVPTQSVTPPPVETVPVGAGKPWYLNP